MAVGMRVVVGSVVAMGMSVAVGMGVAVIFAQDVGRNGCGGGGVVAEMDVLLQDE